VQEKEFIKKLKKRDKGAFELLIDKYQNKIFGLISLIVNNPSVTEDLAQEVFLRIFKGIPYFRGESKLSTWIYRITYNVCMGEIKKAFKNIAKYEAPSHFKEKILTQIYKNSDVFPEKSPIFKGLLLDKNSLYWIIFGFLIPLILMPFSLVIFLQSEKIKELISQLKLAISALTPAQISIINFIVATPILLYGFWLTFKLLREKE